MAAIPESFKKKLARDAELVAAATAANAKLAQVFYLVEKEKIEGGCLHSFFLILCLFGSFDDREMLIYKSKSMKELRSMPMNMTR